MSGVDDATLWGPGYITIEGPQGPPGKDGEPNVLTIGTVTQGEVAAATITGESPNQVLNLQLPQGPAGNQGVPGAGTSLSIGTVTTGSAAASITGAPPNQVLNLVLPEGTQGPAGPPGPVRVLFGAAFGFAEGYTAGLDLTTSLPLVWTEVKMDANAEYPVISTSEILIPEDWGNTYFQVQVHLDQVAAAPVGTGHKIIITHTRGTTDTSWQIDGLELTSLPMLMLQDDKIKVTYQSDSVDAPGLAATSYVYIKPVGVGVPL